MKCVCIRDVKMDHTGETMFMRGHLYEYHPEERHCLINCEGEPHYVSGPALDDADFFNTHFIQVEEKPNSFMYGGRS